MVHVLHSIGNLLNVNYAKKLSQVKLKFFKILYRNLGSFDVEGKKFDLIEIEKPESAFIILEILSKEKNLSRGVHVIKMETKSNIRLVLNN